MNKVFFVALTFTSCMYASEQSPSQVARTIKTSVSAGSLRKNDSKKIDVDELLQSISTNSNSPVVRVRKQSFGNHNEFLTSDNRFKNEENITVAVFKRNRSETK